MLSVAANPITISFTRIHRMYADGLPVPLLADWHNPVQPLVRFPHTSDPEADTPVAGAPESSGPSAGLFDLRSLRNRVVTCK